MSHITYTLYKIYSYNLPFTFFVFDQYNYNWYYFQFSHKSFSIGSFCNLHLFFRYLDKTPHHWHPEHGVVVSAIEDVNKIKMALYVTHTMNFQDWGEKNKRRSDLVIEMKKIFEDLNIKYNLLPQTMHLVHPVKNVMEG